MSDWDRIVREHGPLVYATAKRILGNAADAEDVSQEVLIEALRLTQTRPVRLEAGLLRRLAACRAIDRLRLRRNIQPIHGMAVRDFSPGPAETAAARELAERLRQALCQLPTREAEVFALRYFEDQSYQQIADSLEMQPNAVAQALHKARAKLESLLSEASKGA